MTLLVDKAAIRKWADSLGEDGILKEIERKESEITRWQTEYEQFHLKSIRDCIVIGREDVARYKWMLSDLRRRNKKAKGKLR